MAPRTTSDRAASGKITKIALLASACVIAVAGLARALARDGLPGQTSDRAVTGDHAPAPTPTTAAITPAIVRTAAPEPPPSSRQVVSPEEAVLHGPKENLVPPEIKVEFEIDPRGVATAEPLVPKVIEEKLDDALPRGPAPDGPLVPRTIQEVDDGQKAPVRRP